MLCCALQSQEIATGVEGGTRGPQEKAWLSGPDGKVVGNRPFPTTQQGTELQDRIRSASGQGHAWSMPGCGFMAWVYVTSLRNIIRSIANWILLRALQKPDPGLSSSPARQLPLSSEPPFSCWDFSSQGLPGELYGALSDHPCAVASSQKG